MHIKEIPPCSAFADCQGLAKKVWKRCPVNISLPSCPSVSMLEWIEHIFQAVTLNDRNLVAMIMWLLWCRRNMLLHDGKRWDCAELIQKACDLSSEYLHAISCSEDIRSQHTTEPAIWRPPTATGACIKVNVDAAKLLSANAAGFALIVGMVTVLFWVPRQSAVSGQLKVRQWRLLRLDMESFLHWKWDSQM